MFAHGGGGESVKFLWIKPSPVKKKGAQDAAALYREYFAVTPPKRIGFPSIVIHPLREFPDTWRYIKLL